MLYIYSIQETKNKSIYIVIYISSIYIVIYIYISDRRIMRIHEIEMLNKATSYSR